jgi:hypothetical protein
MVMFMKKSKTPPSSQRGKRPIDDACRGKNNQAEG